MMCMQMRVVIYLESRGLQSFGELAELLSTNRNGDFKRTAACLYAYGIFHRCELLRHGGCRPEEDYGSSQSREQHQLILRGDSRSIKQVSEAADPRCVCSEREKLRTRQVFGRYA